MDLATLERSLEDAQRKFNQVDLEPVVFKIDLFSRSPPTSPSQSHSSSTHHPSSPRRLQALAADKSQFYHEMSLRKQEFEDQNHFHPRISAALAREQGNRLHQESFSRDQKLRAQRLKQEEESDFVAVRSSQPSRGNQLYFPQIPTAPLHERAESIMRARQDELNRLRREREEKEEDNLRRPVVLVDVDQVTERLVNQAEAMDRKKANERRTVLALRQPRGKPEINPYSQVLAARTHEGLSFMERQEKIKLERESKILQRMQCQEFEEKTSRVLSPESTERLVVRLAEEDFRRLQRNRQDQEKEFFRKNCSFAPKLNPNSRQLAPQGSGGTQELFLNANGKRKLQHVKEKWQSESMKECTFQPNHHNNNASSSLRHHHVIQSTEGRETRIRREEERALKLEETKLALRRREEEECTFHPHVNRNDGLRLQLEQPRRVIKGMDAHLQRQHRVDVKKQELREREEKAFLTTLPPLTRRYTVAQPFHLSTNRSDARSYTPRSTRETMQDEYDH